MLGNPHVLVRVSRPTHPSSCGPGSLRRAGTGGWLGAALRPPCLPGPLLWCAAGVQRGERRVHGLRPAAGAAGPEAVSPARAPGRPALPPPSPAAALGPVGRSGPTPGTLYRGGHPSLPRLHRPTRAPCESHAAEKAPPARHHAPWPRALAPVPAGTPAHAPPLRLSPSQMRLERGWVQRPGKTGSPADRRRPTWQPGDRSPERPASWCSLGRERRGRLAGRQLLTLRQLCVAPHHQNKRSRGPPAWLSASDCARCGGTVTFHMAPDACRAHVLPGVGPAFMLNTGRAKPRARGLGRGWQPASQPRVSPPARRPAQVR